MVVLPAASTGQQDFHAYGAKRLTEVAAVREHVLDLAGHGDSALPTGYIALCLH